jgi:hypothetical protein
MTHIDKSGELKRKKKTRDANEGIGGDRGRTRKNFVGVIVHENGQ